MKSIRVFLGLFIVSVIFLTACNHPDTTKVTVYFAKNGQASIEQQKLPLIDRFLNLFSGKAYAQIHQPSDTQYYVLIVIGDDYAVANASAPGTASSISIEVPSGNNRVFALFSYSDADEINYTGQHVANLTGGNVSFTINMYPCLTDVYAESLTENDYISLSWSFDSTTLMGHTYVEIYRACLGTSCDGTFSPTPIQTLLLVESPNFDDYDSLIPGNAYYYFLRIPTPSFGGGGMPVPASIEDYYTNYYYYIFTEAMYGVQYVYGI